MIGGNMEWIFAIFALILGVAIFLLAALGFIAIWVIDIIKKPYRRR